MRIALIMLDQNYGGIQQDFLDHSIELSKRGFPVLCVIRNESVVENKLREVGISSIAVINNRFGFHDQFAIRQIGEVLDEFFSYPPPHIVQTFGSRATLFASKLKSQVRRWPLIASLPNSINHKYYKGADILVPSTNQMATSNYYKNLVDPVFSKVIPRFSRVEPVSEAVSRSRITKIFAAGRFVRKNTIKPNARITALRAIWLDWITTTVHFHQNKHSNAATSSPSPAMHGSGNDPIRSTVTNAYCSRSDVAVSLSVLAASRLSGHAVHI